MPASSTNSFGLNTLTDDGAYEHGVDGGRGVGPTFDLPVRHPRIGPREPAAHRDPLTRGSGSYSPVYVSRRPRDRRR